MVAPSAHNPIARRWPRAAPGAAAVALAVAVSGCLLIPVPDRHGLQAMESGQFLVGAWLGSWPADGNPAIDAFERKAGFRPDLVDVYIDWRTPVANVTHSLAHIASRGALPILTWEAQTITTKDILAGTRPITLRDGRTLALDDYLAEFAAGVCRSASAAAQPVLVRTLHEMNGSWFAWGITYRDAGGHMPNSVDTYRRAWVKVHDAFSSRCGDQVKFVWAVNHYSVGEGADFTNAYPGKDYVDFVGIDGYNWGANAHWGWQDFQTIFKPGLCALSTIPDKPILVDEVASSEKGGDKAKWIADMYVRLGQYPRVRGFVWFDDAKFEIEVHGPMDWNVDSSAAALAAYKAGAGQVLDGRGQGGGVQASAPAPAAPVKC